MPVKLLQRLPILILVAVYLGAMVVQAAVMLPSPAPAMAGGMMHQQGDSGDPMPCKGKVPRTGCITALGCVFLVSLPGLPDLSLFTATEWSSVAYGGSTPSLHGRSIKPALGPPISRA
jgi:hypothetical protein